MNFNNSLNDFISYNQQQGNDVSDIISILGDNDIQSSNNIAVNQLFSTYKSNCNT